MLVEGYQYFFLISSVLSRELHFFLVSVLVEILDYAFATC